jgi:hypothetical protein
MDCSGMAMAGVRLARMDGEKANVALLGRRLQVMDRLTICSTMLVLVL